MTANCRDTLRNIPMYSLIFSVSKYDEDNDETKVAWISLLYMLMTYLAIKWDG
jgi:hypothetical protein